MDTLLGTFKRRMPFVDWFFSSGRVEIERCEVWLVVMTSLDANKPTVHGGLDPAQAAFSVLVTARPVQFIPIMIVHPELIRLEYQHRFPSTRRQEERF